MAEDFAIGIDFGTTKSLLSFTPRGTNPPMPPQYATYSAKHKLAPTKDDIPFSRQGSGVVVQPVPTCVSINMERSTERLLHLISGFQAINPHAQRAELVEIFTNLKELASESGSKRLLTGLALPVEGFIAHFLWSLRRNANELVHLPWNSKGVTITVPAKAGILQRMTMQFAGAVAGLEGKIELLEEPVAAYLFHQHIRPDYFSTQANKPRYALVVDFGGGTCDLAIISFLRGELPRVISRSMGFFGGEKIDEMFLKAYWLRDNARRDSLPITWKDFQELPKVNRHLLLAHARLTKELLSTTLKTHAQDITGSIPGLNAELISPRISQQELLTLLENSTFEAKYADNYEVRSASLKKHIENLLLDVLDKAMDETRKNVAINRSIISSLIITGGSSLLPGVRDWALDFLKNPAGKGRFNETLEKNPENIHVDFPDVAVAGGAAIHQNYRYHPTQSYRKVITPTLSSRYWLIHYQDKNRIPHEIELGRVGESLPIDRTTYWSARVIFPARRWANGEMKLVIGEGNYSETYSPKWAVEYPLPKKFGGAANSVAALLKAILITYSIDEFGVLQKISWIPGFLPSGWSTGNIQEVFTPSHTATELQTQLDNLRLENIGLILSFKKKFIPH